MKHGDDFIHGKIGTLSLCFIIITESNTIDDAFTFAWLLSCCYPYIIHTYMSSSCVGRYNAHDVGIGVILVFGTMSCSTSH